MTFQSLSAWGQVEEAKRANVNLTREDLDEAIAKVGEETERRKVASRVASIPFDHWHHDLQTVDILLDQQPPDIERARRLIDDLSREIYREMR